jgi:micrococcal nuclease
MGTLFPPTHTRVSGAITRGCAVIYIFSVLGLSACAPAGSAFQEGEPAPDAGLDSTGDLIPGEEVLPNDWIEAPIGWCDDPANLANIIWVVDGDTVELESGDRIRYIGVDAPETLSSDCWAQEAKATLAEFTPLHGPVCLLQDPQGPNKDNFDRLLRYVFVANEGEWGMQNARLVRLGAARAYHEFLVGKAYGAAIAAAEVAAQAENRGGWGSCDNW